SIDASTRPFDIPSSSANRIAMASRSMPAGEAPEFRLEGVYPNPLVASATIVYTLPGAGPVRLGVFDLLGRRIATLVDGVQGAGRHEAKWDRSIASSSRASFGVYFARLEFVGQSAQTKLVIAR